MSTNVGMTFPEWVRDNYLSYFYDEGLEDGGELPDYTKDEIKILTEELPEYGFHLTEQLMFCLWSDWSRRDDAGWLSISKTIGSRDVVDFVRHYRREWNIYTDKVRKGDRQ